MQQAEEKAAREEEKRQLDARLAAESEERRRQLERLNDPSHAVEEIEEDPIKQVKSEDPPAGSDDEDGAFNHLCDGASDDEDGEPAEGMSCPRSA